MSEIYKIENKKVHIKWLLCAIYYTNLQISRTFSFYMYLVGPALGVLLLIT